MMNKLTSVAVLLLMAVSMALAADPVVLVQRGTMEAGLADTKNQYGHAIDGQTSYHVFQNKNITKVETINGVQSASVFVSAATWSAASNNATLTPFYGFGVSGNNLLWTGPGSHAVWKADRTTGALSQLVTRDAISSYVGQTASTVSAQTVAPNGGLTFRESKTNAILNADLNGTLTTVLEASVLTAATGYATITSGMAYDAANALYWSHNDNDNVYRLNTNGTIEKVLSSASILALTRGSGAYVYDMLVGGDERLYFSDGTSKSILAFDPDLGDASLELLTTDATAAITLGWYKDGATDYLTYHSYTGDLMGIAIPEPATLGLLVAGGAALLRKRRS